MLVRMLALVRVGLKRLGLLPVAKRAVAAVFIILARLRVSERLTTRLKMLIEGATFAGVDNVHDLPPIYGYWSERYLRPKCELLGFSDLHDFYLTYLCRAAEAIPFGRACRVVSIGSGNGDLEVELAIRLQHRSHRSFIMECLDANDSMLRRCSAHARAAGVQESIKPSKGDFNRWRPDGLYDAVIANHSLHHVVSLEALFDAIRQVLQPSGYFLAVDMIGRNGHMRWPETLAIVREYWKVLSREQKFNHSLGRHEEEFINWDASRWGFEGVRAQDVLSLLVTRFHFELFLAWGGIIDPFVDRSFGPNFDPGEERDRALIHAITERNDQELLAGTVKPTQMFAAMTVSATRAKTKQWANLSPERALRGSGA